MITLTTEQTQQIEEALSGAVSDSKAMGWITISQALALATIRAAKAQVGQGPVNDVCVRCGGNCPRFMCDTYKDWADKEPVSRECLIAPVKQAEQEPVAIDWEPLQNFWRNNSSIDWGELESAVKCAIATTVRTKDLTDEEIGEIYGKFQDNLLIQLGDFARAVIAAYKEKNK